MAVYNVKLRTLCPLHIGDGDELRQDFDFAVHAGRTYRLNVDAILLDKIDQMQPDRSGSYRLPGKMLTDADYNNLAYFRYVLNGQPRSQKVDARVRSFIKDVYDCPYIPGSSLKGALRTALAWTAWREVQPRLDRNAIGRSKSWAGQPLEKKIFGPDPNHSLMRALHVADLFGPEQAGGRLLLVNAQVLTLKSHASPIELEAVAGDTEFLGTITIDETLFSPQAEAQLHFGNRRKWLDQLMQRIQAHSRGRIEALAAWYEKADGTEAIARFYRQLAGSDLQPNQALVQLGWGGGWDSKTFGTRLQADPQLFEALVRDFRMHRAGRNTPPRKAGDPFPRSKRAAMLVKEGVARPAAPFGWALIEMSTS